MLERNQLLIDLSAKNVYLTAGNCGYIDSREIRQDFDTEKKYRF